MAIHISFWSSLSHHMALGHRVCSPSSLHSGITAACVYYKQDTDTFCGKRRPPAEAEGQQWEAIEQGQAD